MVFMKDIIAIGSTTYDLVFRTEFPTIRFPRVASKKALLVPFGEKYAGENMVPTLGGNAAHAAVTFARNNFSTALVSRIGDDAVAEAILNALKREGIDVCFLEKSKGEFSPMSVLFVQGGERSIITYHGALNSFSLSSALVKELKARWWYVSLSGDSYKELDALLAYAQKNNIRVALNPSGRHISKGKKHLLAQLSKISFLVLNETEASKLVGVPFSQSARVFNKLDSMVPGIVAITQGERGVMVSDGERVYKAGVFKEKKRVDRTGAGDAFGSGFVAVLARERGEYTPKVIKRAIAFASANATSVVETPGGTAGIMSFKKFQKEKRWRRFNIRVSPTSK